MRTPSGERREWVKPIMFSGGLGNLDADHVDKQVRRGKSDGELGFKHMGAISAYASSCDNITSRATRKTGHYVLLKASPLFPQPPAKDLLVVKIGGPAYRYDMLLYLMPCGFCANYVLLAAAYHVL